MRIRIALAALLVGLAVSASACGSDSPGADASGDGAGLGNMTGAGTTRPECPFTVQQVNDITGRSLKDQGNCLFGDGIASLTVTTASELAGTTTYDYARQQAEQSYLKVVDIDQGDRGFMAIKDIEAQAVVVSKKGSYTLVMSSFSFDSAKYDSTLRALLDQIFGASAADAPAATALPDACALITKADAEKLTGTPLEDGVPVRESCTYTGPVSGPTAQVEVYVGDGAQKMLDIDRDLKHEFAEVQSVGDEAYLEDGAVFFRKSGVWVAIRLVLLNDPAENRDSLEAAARTASARM